LRVGRDYMSLPGSNDFRARWEKLGMWLVSLDLWARGTNWASHYLAPVTLEPRGGAEPDSCTHLC
jgi:hypothetical protein